MLARDYHRCGGQTTCSAMIRLKFVFLEHELIVNVLDIGQVEVRLCYQERGIVRVRLFAYQIGDGLQR